MELTLLILCGAALGSFMNVVIYRLPRQESILWPGSHCPQCRRKIKPWENIPIVSYLALRGRCAGCAQHIPLRYLLVEVLTPTLLVGLYFLHGLQWAYFKNSILLLLLIPAAFIDLDHRLILNKITIPGMFLGLALSAAADPQHFWHPILGLLAGGGFLWIVALVGEWIYKQESMGGGDIKFGAMIGAFMNAQSIILSLFLAFFIASLFIVVGLALGRIERRSAVPFGPFIALGAFVVMNFQDQIVRFYLRLIGF